MLHVSMFCRRIMLKRGGGYVMAFRLAFNGLRTEIRHFPVHSIGRWWVVQLIRGQKGTQKQGHA